MNDKFAIVKVLAGFILFVLIVAILYTSYHIFQITFCVFSLVYKSWIVSTLLTIGMIYLTRNKIKPLFSQFVFGVSMMATLGVLIPAIAVMLNFAFSSSEVVTKKYQLVKVDEIMDYDEVLDVKIGPPKPTIKLFNITIEHAGILHHFQVWPENRNILKGEVVSLPVSKGLYGYEIINWND